MAKVWELLDKAYLLIDAGHLNQALFLVEQVITRDPQNIQAWDVYISIFNSRSELQALKDTVDTIWETKVRDKDYLNANRSHILRRINERIASL